MTKKSGISNISDENLIKKIYIPSAFEFGIGIVVSITDVVFITQVDLTLLNVMMIMINLLVVGYVATGVGANIAAAKLMSAEPHASCADRAASGRVFLLALLLGLATTFFAILLGPILASIVEVNPHYQRASEFIIVILAVNVIFVGIFKAQAAILVIHAKSKICLLATISVVVINIALNFLFYFLFFGADPQIFAISIPVATVFSRGAVSAILFAYLIKWKLVEFELKSLFYSKSIKKVARMARTSCVSSLETLSYACITYVFLIVLAKINPELLVVRNYAAPWFLLVFASTIAWSNLANRQLAFDGIPINRVGYLTFKWIVVRSIATATVWALLTSIILCVLMSGRMELRVSFYYLISLLLSLSAIEVLRSLNIITLTALRLHNDVTRPAYFAVVTQGAIGGVLWLISMTWSENKAGFIQAASLFALVAIVLDEAIRTALNIMHFRSTVLHRANGDVH